MIRIQRPPEERSCCQKDRGIMSRRLVMPRKPLDIKLTDHPFSRERSPQLLSLPSWRRTGVGRAHKHNKPQQKAGANVSIILGHFQKCLTEKAAFSDSFFVYTLSFTFLILMVPDTICIYNKTTNRCTYRLRSISWIEIIPFT